MSTVEEQEKITYGGVVFDVLVESITLRNRAIEDLEAKLADAEKRIGELGEVIAERNATQNKALANVDKLREENAQLKARVAELEKKERAEVERFPVPEDCNGMFYVGLFFNHGTPRDVYFDSRTGDLLTVDSAGNVVAIWRPNEVDTMLASYGEDIFALARNLIKEIASE